jgi:hypothetical protein
MQVFSFRAENTGEILGIFLDSRLVRFSSFSSFSSLYIYIYMCVCVCVCVSFHLSIFLSFCLSLSLLPRPGKRGVGRTSLEKPNTEDLERLCGLEQDRVSSWCVYAGAVWFPLVKGGHADAEGNMSCWEDLTVIIDAVAFALFALPPSNNRIPCLSNIVS